MNERPFITLTTEDVNIGEGALAVAIDALDAFHHNDNIGTSVLVGGVWHRVDETPDALRDLIADARDGLFA